MRALSSIKHSGQAAEPAGRSSDKASTLRASKQPGTDEQQTDPRYPAGGPEGVGNSSSSSRPRYSSRDLMRRALESENVTMPSSIKKDLQGLEVAALLKKASKLPPKLAVLLKDYSVKGVKWLVDILLHPSHLGPQLAGVWDFIKKEAHHMYLSFRLLGQDVSTCASLLRRVASGHKLSRRERKLLVRTTSDLFRLVPFSVFILVPFMELMLPVALALFPNMLPSQFQTDLKKEEDLKRQLTLRVELAQFLSETSAEYSKLLAAKGEGATKKGAEEMLALLKRTRAGDTLNSEEILAVASLFNDEMTLENISKAQLLAMARYMGVSTFGTEAILRHRLRSKMKDLKADDQQILWEGVDALSKEELAEASNARGMRSVGLTKEGLRLQLDQWLDLSVNRNVPIVMLILSRAIQLQSHVVSGGTAERVLEKSIAALDETVLNEAILSGTAEDSKDSTIKRRELQLQAVQHQQKLIDMERKAADAAAAADEAAVKADEVRARCSHVLAEHTAGRATADEAAQAKAEVQAAEEAAAEAGKKAESLFSLLSGEADDSYRAAVDDVRSKLQLGEESGVEDGDLIDPERITQMGKDAGLTAESISTLSMLASDSAVLQERATLARIKAQRMQEQAEKMLAKGRIDRKKPVEDAGEQTARAEQSEAQHGEGAGSGSSRKSSSKKEAPNSVQSMLDTMLTRLEGQVDSVDTAIGDKLHLLDRDRDGVLSRAELEDVMRRLLKVKGLEETDVHALGDLLDLDKDGNITTDDLNMIAGVLQKSKQHESESTQGASSDDFSDFDEHAQEDNAEKR